MQTYRVFVRRHYIDVCYFDVEADSERKAKNAARKAAYRLRPNAREHATDNGWIPEKPVAIDRIGQSASEPTMVNLFYHAPNGTKCYIDE